MKYLSLLSIVVFSLAVLVSCGGEAPKNTKKERKEIKTKKAEAKLMSDKSSVSATSEKSEEQDVTGATPEQLEKAKKLIAGISDADLEAVKAGKKFKMLCAACHGFNGDLNVNGAKDLTISKASLEDRVAQVYFGKGLMTPFKGIMSDAEIVAVSKYLETLRD